MYGRNDLRGTLQPQTAKPPATPFKGASYGRFYEEAPSEEGAGFSTWYTRGQNLVVAYSKVRAGAVLERRGQADEYALLIPEAGVSARVSAGDEVQQVEGPVVVFIPPGDSRIEALSDGDLFRLVTTRSEDLVARCANAEAYAEPDPNVPPFEAWPEPVGGYRIRAYRGDVPPEPGRFGRLYRGSTIMVNFGSGRQGPRDITNMSPHHHVDFEQYSIATAGTYVHHLRWPWTTDLGHWREDEHEFCASPSVAVIPPPATHTSQGMSDGLNRLCDAFCPPRRDFSEREGWVINAADYPMPSFEGGAQS